MLTTLDMGVLLLLGGGAVLGALRGFVTEVLSLFAWGLAIFALKLLHAPATALATPHVGGKGPAALLCFVLIFAVTFLGGRWVARSIGRRTKSSVLGPVDRLLGLGFGALKGLLIATVLFLGVNLVIDMWSGQAAGRPAWLRTSRTYPLLNASGRAVVEFVRTHRGAATRPADNAATAP